MFSWQRNPSNGVIYLIFKVVKLTRECFALRSCCSQQNYVPIKGWFMLCVGFAVRMFSAFISISNFPSVSLKLAGTDRTLQYHRKLWGHCGALKPTTQTQNAATCFEKWCDFFFFFGRRICVSWIETTNISAVLHHLGRGTKNWGTTCRSDGS